MDKLDLVVSLTFVGLAVVGAMFLVSVFFAVAEHQIIGVVISASGYGLVPSSAFITLEKLNS